MNQKKEVIKDWITRVNDEGKNLTDWEECFMESITEKFDRRGWLSDKEVEILERIYCDKVR